MNPHPALEPLLNSLLNHSLQAGVLVLLVLAAQGLFRRLLTARWRFTLWWIVLIFLLVPFRPQSDFSLFNYWKIHVRIEGPRYPSVHAGPDPVADSTFHTVQPASAEFAHESLAANPTPPTRVAQTEAPAEAQPLPSETVVNVPNVSELRTLSADDLILPGVMALWLAGVLLLGGYVLVKCVHFRRRLAKATGLAGGELPELLDQCRCELGIRRSVELLETATVQSPALFGLFRPRLLLPPGLAGQFSREQLRYIFLHELAHVKRGDLWLNWLVTASQVVHWFNPLLWLGFARLRADRELACDELVLLHVGEDAGKSYGQTIIQLLESFNRPAATPGLVGIVEDRKQMQRRITMIARFKRPSRRAALAVVLVTGLGAIGLTHARTDMPNERKFAQAKPVAPVSAPVEGEKRNKGDNIIQAQNNIDTRPSFVVSGFVVDAVTREPIPEFEATLGEIRQGLPLGFRSTPRVKGKDGKFSLRVPYPRFYKEYVIKIDSEGYLPSVSSNLMVVLGDQHLDFALKSGSGPSGVVLLPNGQPAMGATVVLLGLEGAVHMDKPAQVRKIDQRLGMLHTETDASGRFQFKPMLDAHTLVIVHEQGCAEIPVGELDHTRPITISAYGRVEGRLLFHGKPVVNETISLTTMHYRYGYGERSFAPLDLFFEVKTGSDGHFAFPKVPPGERKVAHRLSFRDGKLGEFPLSHDFVLTVVPGQTNRVEIGGTGRSIIGRVAAPDRVGSIDWQHDVQRLVSDDDELPGIIRPKPEDYETSAVWAEASKKFSAMHRDYWMSEEGRTRDRVRRKYVPAFNEDGSFSISDVPPGTYKLQITVTEPDEDARGNGQSGPVIGSLSVDVIVPDAGAGRIDQPLDLGTLTLKPTPPQSNWRRGLRIGDLAPMFETKSVDGKPIKLADYRGKYVLLEFWATWCQPCIAELPHLKEMHEVYGNDNRFVMIGLSLDDNIDRPREFVRKHDLKWIQGFYGVGQTTTVPIEYAFTRQGIPSLLLIGPDGRIIAKENHASPIRAVLDKALGHK